MQRYMHFALTLSLALATAACAASGGNSGGGGGGGGTYTGSDTTSGSGTATGDSTKNTAAVGATSDSGQKDNVQVDKAAAKADVEAQTNKIGAMNAGEQLVLWIASTGADGSKVLEVHIDTSKYKLPATGIPVGAVNSDVWVSYTVANATGGGIYQSKGTGTIDINTCPAKSGLAVTGKFNGVKVEAEAAVGGPKSYTLDGTFNLVYFGADASLQCKPVEQPKTDAGSTTTPAGTCDGTFCDNGANKTRNCCPYMPCIQPCVQECSNSTISCAMGCMADQACAEKCVKDAFTCQNACFGKCNVSATCLAAAEKLSQCEDTNAKACQSENGTDDKCLAQKCCNEFKATF